jgi:phosphatidylglycerophosphatase A
MKPMTIGTRIKWLVATCFGLGYSPVMPGTFGALPGLATFLIVACPTLGVPRDVAIWILAASLLFWCVATIVLAKWAEEFWQKKDCGIFVTDEVAGYLLTVLIFWPAGMCLWHVAAWTFVFSRGIDIIKIPPAKQAEYLPLGWGVLLDDLIASCYAGGILWFAHCQGWLEIVHSQLGV